MSGQPPAALDHEAVPAALSAYSMAGPNTGCPASAANPWHYPAEGICAGCGGVIRAEQSGDAWAHTGRMPGDPR